MRTHDQIDSIFPTHDAIPAEYRVEVPLEQTEYLIDGELRHWDGPMRDVLAVAYVDGERVRLGSYPRLDSATALEALHAAERAYGHGRGPWPMMTVAERIRHIEGFIPRMVEQRDAVVKLIMWEIGKNLSSARKEFDRTVDYIRATIDAVKDQDREASRFVIENGTIGQIRMAPLGVVLCMGPYNYPLNELYTTLFPALIMGNTAVVKPRKFGALLHRPLLEAFRDSFPPGVVNFAYGDGSAIAGPIMEAGSIGALAFIGSSAVADMLTKQHPKPHTLRLALGMDAKNPAIVLPDADLDLAVKESVRGALSFNGQRCTALKMLFVHRSLVDDFLARLTAAIEGLAIGMPWDDAAITPLPLLGKTRYLTDLIDDATAKGARVVNPLGGTVNRTFMYPAVLYPVNDQMRVYHEEQFGPVIPVRAFDDIEEPIQYIIESNYGQQASVFGTDPDHIARLIDPLMNQVCRVNLNGQCQRGPDAFPFTGRKDSAEGTLSVTEALRVFSIQTLVATQANADNSALINDIVRTRRSTFLSTDFIF